MKKIGLQILALVLVTGLLSASAQAYTVSVTTPADDSTSVNAGAQVSYTFTVNNTTAGALSAQVSIPVPSGPSGITFSSITLPSTGGTWTLSGSTSSNPIIYTNPSFSANGSSTFTVNFMTPSNAAAASQNILFAPSIADAGGANLATAVTRKVSTTVLCDMVVTLTKMATDPANYIRGGRRSLTWKFQNLGPSDATNVLFSITNATGTTYEYSSGLSGFFGVDTETTNTSGVAGTKSIHFPVYPAGSSTLWQYDENILSTAAFGTITDTTTVTTSTNEVGNTANNTFTLPFSVGPYTANVTTPSTDNTSVNAGTQVSYTFIVTNATAGALNARVSIPVPSGPAGVTFNAITPPSTGGTWTLSGSTSANPIVYTNPSFTANGSSTFTVSFTIPANVPAASQNILFAPSISDGGGTNLVTAATRMVSTTVLCDVLVTLTKMVTDPANYTRGSGNNRRSLTWKFQNLGPSDAKNVLFSITNAPGTAFEYSSGISGNFLVDFETTNVSGVPGTKSIHFPVYAAGTSTLWQYDETILSNAAIGLNSITDTATVTTDTNEVGNTLNNSFPLSFTVVATTDLSLSGVTAPTGGIVAGGVNPFVYTFTASNTGVDTGAEISINVPSNARYSAFTSLPSGWTSTGIAPGNSGVVKLTNTNFAAGTTASFSLPISIPAASTGSVLIQPTIGFSANFLNNTEATPPNNTSTPGSTLTILTGTDLNLTNPAPVAPASAAAGVNYISTFTVKNTGATVTGTTTVSIPLGNALYQSLTAPGWTITGPTLGVVTATINNLPVGSTTFTLTLKSTASQSGSLTISPTITTSSSTVGDIDTSNNTTSFSTLINNTADLAILNLMGPATTVAGSGTNFIYTFSVQNLATSVATTDARVTFSIPSNARFQGLDAPGWSLPTVPVIGTAGGSVVATLAGLVPGATPTLFTLTLSTDLLYTGTITINPQVAPPVGSGITDPTPATVVGSNSNQSVTTQIQNPINLALSAVTAPTSVMGGAGSAFSMTFTASNLTASSPTCPVKISFPLVSNAVYQSFSAPAGWTVTSTNNPGDTSGTVTVTHPGFATNTTSGVFTLNLTVDASATGTISITPTISSNEVAPLQFLETDSSDNSRTGTTSIISADLSVAITQTVDSQNNVIAGNLLTYICSVVNAGPSTATNVSFVLPVPSNVVYDSATVPSGWTLTAPAKGAQGNVSATIPSMVKGGAIILVSVLVNANLTSGTVTTTANVSNTVTDPNTNDNSFKASANIIPQPSISITGGAFPEGDSPGANSASVQVTMSSKNTQVVTVDYATVDGSATSPSNYTGQTGTLTFSPNNPTTQTITIPFNGNTTVNPDQTFTVVLTNAMNASLGTASAAVTIANDDFGGTIQFSSATYTANGNAASAALLVTRTGGIASGVSFDYATTDGTAAGGLDYAVTSGTVTFDAGQTSKIINIPLLNKYGAVPDLTFSVGLGSAKGGGVIGATNIATVTLKAAPTITSALSVSSQINSAFFYQATASGQPNVVISVPNSSLPQGLIFVNGFISGTPTQVGSFVVPISATNAVGVDTQNLMIEITAIPQPVGVVASTLDSDGDGFPDELEEFVNSFNPTAVQSKDNFKSTPSSNNAPAVNGSILKSKLAINLNFAKTNADKLVLSGVVTLPSGFADSGKVVYVDVGGVTRRFALDADGKNKIGTDSIAFKFGQSSSVPGVSQIASFVLVIQKSSFADRLVDEGLTNETLSKVPRTVPVYVMLNDTLNSVMQSQTYTSKVKKTGKSNNP